MTRRLTRGPDTHSRIVTQKFPGINDKLSRELTLFAKKSKPGTVPYPEAFSVSPERHHTVTRARPGYHRRKSWPEIRTLRLPRIGKKTIG